MAVYPMAAISDRMEPPGWPEEPHACERCGHHDCLVIVGGGHVVDRVDACCLERDEDGTDGQLCDLAPDDTAEGRGCCSWVPAFRGA